MAESPARLNIVASGGRGRRSAACLIACAIIVVVAGCSHATSLSSKSTCKQFLKASASAEQRAVKDIGVQLGNTLAGSPLEAATITTECGQDPSQILGDVLAPSGQQLTAPTGGAARSSDYEATITKCAIRGDSIDVEGSFTNRAGHDQNYSLTIVGSDSNGVRIGTSDAITITASAGQKQSWSTEIPLDGTTGVVTCGISEVLYST